METIQKTTQVPNSKTSEELEKEYEESSQEPDENMETAFVTFYKKLPK